MYNGVGRKVSMGNTSRPVTKSQTYPLNNIPLDMKEEILMKLKAKYISRLITISKSWSSIIRSKSFTTLYLSRSLTQPRMLFSMDRRDIRMQFFHSCSQEDPSADHHRVRCYPPNPDIWYEFTPPVRGLIGCLNHNTTVMVGNPNTCQFVTLPRVKTSRKDKFVFFGYDPVDDVYKVLCMTATRRKYVVSQEHQVFTLGAKKKKWRKVECKHPYYTPRRTQGICSNGVVYYLAWINQYTVQTLICFDVRSEKISFVKLPGDVRIVSHYGEKIAVTNELDDGTLDLWVLEDASKEEWSKVSIVFPPLTDLFGYNRTYRFRGTLGTGELLFAPCFYVDPYFLLCYDPKENKATKIEIDGVENRFASVEVYLNHVESPMYLQI